MIIKELRYFIYENYYRRIGFPKFNETSEKEDFLLLVATKSIKKIFGPINIKEYY